MTRRRYKIKETAVPCTTKIILFLGNEVADISRMAAAMFSDKRKVLYVDLTSTGKYFFKFLGNTKENTVLYHNICYTRELFTAEESWSEYDVVILCSERANEITLPIQDIYVVCGIDRGSIAGLESIMKSEVLTKKVYTLIIRASEKQVDYFKAQRAFDVLTFDHEPKNVFYLPVNEKDIENELLLDYGSLDMRKISSSMRMVLWDIKEKALDIM